MVENRTGAGGNVALEQVAKGEPDGHTLLVATNGAITINPRAVQEGSGRHPHRRGAGRGAGRGSATSSTINGKVPARTAQDFIALAKAQPGTINYGSAGPGTTPHLALALFAQLAGIDMVHVPYRGIAPAMTDLVAGNIQAIAIGNAHGGAVRRAGHAAQSCGRGGRSAWPICPDVPTAAEIGLPRWEVETWYGLFAPRGTPKPIVDELNGHIRAMFDDPAQQEEIRRELLRRHAAVGGRICGAREGPTSRNGSASSRTRASRPQ